MSGDHNMHCSGNQCQGHAKQQEMDAIGRLRSKAQNEATCFAYRDICDDQQKEIKSLREEVRKWSDRYYSLWSNVGIVNDCTFTDWAAEVNEMYREEE